MSNIAVLDSDEEDAEVSGDWTEAELEMTGAKRATREFQSMLGSKRVDGLAQESKPWAEN